MTEATKTNVLDLRFEVDIDDEKHEVKVKPADLVKFERKYGLTLDEMEKGLKLEHIYYLSWCACVRAGLTPVSTATEEDDVFNEWLSKVDAVDPIEDAPLGSSSDS